MGIRVSYHPLCFPDVSICPVAAEPRLGPLVLVVPIRDGTSNPRPLYLSLASLLFPKHTPP
jgi:hypothetical protein